MEIKILGDYIHTRKLGLNLEKMRASSEKMYNLVKEKFGKDQEHNGQSTLSTELYAKYNLLMYPFEEFHELYTAIRETFHHIDVSDDTHYIQCWLNYYQKGTFIDWHGHWPPEQRGWHGFYCVDCEPSKTTYKLPRNENRKNIIVDVPSINDQLVISKSDGDQHRTWPWEHDDRPRITIAFDIMPREFAQPGFNHWLPL